MNRRQQQQQQQQHLSWRIHSHVVPFKWTHKHKVTSRLEHLIGGYLKVLFISSNDALTELENIVNFWLTSTTGDGGTRRETSRVTTVQPEQQMLEHTGNLQDVALFSGCFILHRATEKNADVEKKTAERNATHDTNAMQSEDATLVEYITCRFTSVDPIRICNTGYCKDICGQKEAP